MDYTLISDGVDEWDLEEVLFVSTHAGWRESSSVQSEGQIHSNQKERFHKEVIVGRAVLIVHRFNSLQVFLSLLYFQIFSFLIIAL